MRDVRPYLVPPEKSIRATRWQRNVDGEWENLSDFVDDWDQRTELILRSSIEYDPTSVREASRLDDGSPLVWNVGWRSTDTKLVGSPLVVPFEEGEAVTLVVPPDRVGSTIMITRRLCLARDRVAAREGEARFAGSVLWEDSTTVRLAGGGAAFPTEVVDFEMINREPLASWYLELPADASLPAMGSMILLINSRDTALVQAVSRARPTEPQQLLVQQMEEGIAVELVRWALSRWADVEAAEDESVGAAARALAKRVLADPASWASSEPDSMALHAAVVSGSRAIKFGRQLNA